VAWLPALTIAAGGLGATQALAHGTGERYDLPLPLGYYIFGSALVVAASFLVTAVFVYRAPSAGRHPHLDLLHLRDGRGSLLRVLERLLQIVGVLVLIATIAAGLFGNQHPAKNLAPTLVWVAWWVGFSLFVALVADIWPPLNPWNTLACWARWGASRALSAYPKGLAEWPAVGSLLAFVWIELVTPYASSPRALASLALAYTLATLAAMRIYGREVWLANGEAFTLLFGLLGRFAPLALLPTSCTAMVRNGTGSRTLILRLPGSGLLGAEVASNAVVAFLLLMLAAVLFDGLLGTAFWRAIEKWLPGDDEGIIAATSGLAGIWLLFLAAYLGACAAMSVMTGRHTSVSIQSHCYALSLVPIAIGYAIAHNFSYLLVQSQTLAALASDPLGVGWNLFGTAGFEPNVGLVDARATWRIAVAAVVIGHVVSMVIAHVIALRIEPTRHSAFRRLVPLTLLMVAYTAVSLSIIADPLVRFRVPDPDYSKPEDRLTKPSLLLAWQNLPSGKGLVLAVGATYQNCTLGIHRLTTWRGQVSGRRLR
jgi:hypothetical protein